MSENPTPDDLLRMSNRLAQAFNTGGRTDSPQEVKDAIEMLAWAGAKIERLEAVVEKLPKTADGVAVVQDDRVWVWDDGELCDVSAGFACLKDGCMDGNTNMPCYSTRESALAASKRAEGETKL